jgi:hypothetical protein
MEGTWASVQELKGKGKRQVGKKDAQAMLSPALDNSALGTHSRVTGTWLPGV